MFFSLRSGNGSGKKQAYYVAKGLAESLSSPSGNKIITLAVISEIVSLIIIVLIEIGVIRAYLGNLTAKEADVVKSRLLSRIKTDNSLIDKELEYTI